MSGVMIIGQLLRSDPNRPVSVPDASIKIGVLPDGIHLPLILVAEVSQVERQMLKRSGTVRTTDRIAVTGRFASVRDRMALMDWVKNCCAGRTGTVAGYQNVSILTAGRGPDLNGPAGSFEKTQDFRVSYDATT
jgi:hypothetical protein